MNILVAIDLSSASQKILDKAKTLALALPAKICLLHVIEGEPDFLDDEPDLHKAQTNRASKNSLRSTKTYKKR